MRIAPLSPEEILWYVATGEPRDKAGAYAVQGLGSRFIESVSGSYTNVMGLPARSVYLLLKESGNASLARLALSGADVTLPLPSLELHVVHPESAAGEGLRELGAGAVRGPPTERARLNALHTRNVRQPVAEFLRFLGGVASSVRGQQNQELVAPPAKDEVGFADARTSGSSRRISGRRRRPRAPCGR